MTHDPPRPPVVGWFTAYAAAMAAIYVLVGLFGIVVLALPAEKLEMRPEEKLINGIAMVVTCIPLAGIFVAAPMLPRRPWAWIYDIVLIAIGMTSCCCLPATIPLLIHWLKPEAKRYFGRTD